MPSRTLPGIGLKGDWDLGEDGWKDEMDSNLRVLSVIAGQQILEIVAAEPGAPVEGDIVILDETHATHDNEIAVYDEGAWRYIVPIEGMQFFNLDDGVRYEFDGMLWVVASIPGVGDMLGANNLSDVSNPVTAGANIRPVESLVIGASDETTALTAGNGKTTFRMPYAFTVTAVRASLTTAQTGNGAGGIFTVDINEGGASILSTKLTIDNTEKTSTSANTPAVISDPSIADDAEVTVDIDQVGDGTAKGLKVVLIGHRT